MLSILLSVLGAVGVAVSMVLGWPGHPVWSSFAAAATFIAINVTISLLLRKKLEAAFAEIQKIVTDRQAVLMRRVKAAGLYGATPRLQQEIEKEQAQAIRDALAHTDILRPFEKWNLMVAKQVNTLKASFYYQLKDFENADKHLKKALLFDSMIVAMKMARAYKLDNTQEVVKLFNKGVARFKDDKAVILYALYSWILVKQDKIDDAIQILAQAKTRAENPVLKQNWENLVNGHAKRFSNAGLGDTWYALYLEAPQMQRMTPNAGAMRRKGF